MDYLLAQSLSLVFYFITLIVYNRARREYVGGKIAAAIKLLMVFMAILLLADFADYFLVLFLPLGQDTILIIKIILKLIAICVLFFGGVKFFVHKPAASDRIQPSALSEEIDTKSPRPFGTHSDPSIDSTMVIEDIAQALPTLGRYEILEQIGRGAMGVVYKGHDPKLQRPTAIKTIRFSDEFDASRAEEVKEQFYREAEVVAKLSHPNIVTLYDVGEDLDLSYLAMEYLEGESLEQYTRPDNLLPVRKCIDIVVQVCDALEYAHDHGIVHRDIKPANIMLLKNGQVKVTDFGIARVAASSKTHTGIIKGTPYYMSPEQAKGLKVTGASDIFSLGVVFYQLLTGRLPFSGDNLAAIMYQTTTTDPETPTLYNPEINNTAVTILNRCLEKSAQTRYQKAKQLGKDLRLLIQEIEAEKETDFIELSDDDIFYDPIASKTQQPFEDEPDFSDLEQAAKISQKAVEFVPVSIPSETPPSGTIDGEDDHEVQESEAPEIADSNQTSAVSWTKGQNEEHSRLDVFSKHAKRIIFYSCLLLFVAGIGCYFYWKSSHVEVSIIKKRRNLPVDLNNIKAYVVRQKQKKQDKVATAEKKPPAPRGHTAEIDKQKQIEKEQLVKIQKQKQAEKERLAKIEKQKQAEKERLEKIEKQRQAEKERLVKIQKQKQAEILNETSKIDSLISDANKSFALKKYLEAKNRYFSALKIIEESDFKAEQSFVKRKIEIEKALINEDIVYGSKGYVQYKRKWYPPDEYEIQLCRDGYVKYKGNFKKYTKLKNVIRQVTYPIVNSFLTSKYSGQNVHKKQIMLHKLKLNQSTPVSAFFTVLYKWEVWTFSEIGEGQCSLDLHYDIKQDQWNITTGCE